MRARTVCEGVCACMRVSVCMYVRERVGVCVCMHACVGWASAWVFACVSAWMGLEKAHHFGVCLAENPRKNRQIFFGRGDGARSLIYTD